MEPDAKPVTGEMQIALAALEEGALVIVPSETVYGLAANANHAGAIARLFALKQRPSNQPVSLLVADTMMARTYGVLDDRACALADAFWPGAMTLVVRARGGAPLCPAVMAGGTTIGLRVPAHEKTRELLAHFGGALAVPSANRAGKSAPASPRAVAPEILAGAALCLDAGPCASGTASTLVDISAGDIRILRQGDLGLDTIMKALGKREPS